MNESVIEIRFEQPKDIEEVRLLNDMAFGQPEEGRIVDKLRNSCKGILPLEILSNVVYGIRQRSGLFQYRQQILLL